MRRLPSPRTLTPRCGRPGGNKRPGQQHCYRRYSRLAIRARMLSKWTLGEVRPGAHPGYRRHQHRRTAGCTATDCCRTFGRRHRRVPRRPSGPGGRFCQRIAERPDPARAGRRSRRGDPSVPGRARRTWQRRHQRCGLCDACGRTRGCPVAVRIASRGRPGGVRAGGGPGVHQPGTEPDHPDRTAGRAPAGLDGVPHGGHRAAHQDLGAADAGAAPRRSGALPGVGARHRPHRRGGPGHAGHHQCGDRVAVVARRRPPVP